MTIYSKSMKACIEMTDSIGERIIGTGTQEVSYANVSFQLLRKTETNTAKL